MEHVRLTQSEAAAVLREVEDFTVIFNFKYENGLVVGRRSETNTICIISKNTIMLGISPVSIGVAYTSPSEILALLGFLTASMAQSAKIYDMMLAIGAAVATATDVNSKIEDIIKKEKERKG